MAGQGKALPERFGAQVSNTQAFFARKPRVVYQRSLSEEPVVEKRNLPEACGTQARCQIFFGKPTSYVLAVLSLIEKVPVDVEFILNLSVLFQHRRPFAFDDRVIRGGAVEAFNSRPELAVRLQVGVKLPSRPQCAGSRGKRGADIEEMVQER